MRTNRMYAVMCLGHFVSSMCWCVRLVVRWMTGKEHVLHLLVALPVWTKTPLLLDSVSDVSRLLSVCLG